MVAVDTERQINYLLISILSEMKHALKTPGYAHH